MPWQRLVVDVALEIDPETGLFAYREVVLTIMRQSGKTQLSLGVELDRCLSWPERQRVVYTAQTGWDARKKLIEDQVPMIEASPLKAAIARINRGAGNEQVRWRNGSRIELTASTEGAGHGRTIHLGMIDEAWEDEDDRREQALLPAMVTRPDAQLWVTSNGGTEKSVYLKRKVEAGRAAALEDSGHGIAYFEWSIPEEADIDDPEVWWTYMPALGYTITEAAVAHARQSMQEHEFRRAFGNQWTKGRTDRVINEEKWNAVRSTNAKPEGRMRFGLDVAPDRSSAAIVAVGGNVAELIESDEGVAWVVPRAIELAKKWRGRFVVDGGGPASSIADDLEREGVKVDRMPNPDVVKACGRIYDAIADGKIRVRSSGVLDLAAEAVRKRPVGDRFVWSRAASEGDITSFFALTLAFAQTGSGRKPFAATT